MPAPCGHDPPQKDTCDLCKKLDDPRFAKIWTADKYVGGVAGQEVAPCEFLQETTVIDRRDRGCAGCWVFGCDVFERCTVKDELPGVACCGRCPAKLDRGRPAPELLLLENNLAPGDAVVLSAAIESLHRTHPGKFVTAVRSTAQAIWEHHPRVCTPETLEKLAGVLGQEVRKVTADYPGVNQSDERAVHFMQAYCESLEAALGVPIPLAVNRPYLGLSAEEKGWMSQVQEVTGKPSKYWVVNAGHKSDFTAKFWGTANYQEVVDRLRGRVTFVQAGEAHHTHPPLDGVIDLRGKTDTRQYLRLVYNAQGGLGPSTFLQHLCAAFEKPYVLLAGGREPRSWQEYPRQTMFSSVGQLPCCQAKACWRSRVVKLDDGDTKKNESLCERPTPARGGQWVPGCLASIRPEDVARAVAEYR